MFEKFKELTIQGGCFEDQVSLKLFKDGDPLSIIYGRNGSGKTTIALCVKQLAETEEEREKRLQRVANGEDTILTVSADCAISDEFKKNVFVFNEDFLRDNVRVEKNGLNTIVMLGEQVELDDQINEKKEQLRVVLEEIRRQEEQVNKYANAEENISPLFYWAQIRDGLRAEDGWAEIDRQIKGNRVMSRVTDDVVHILTEMEDSAESYEILRERLIADLNLYLRSENAQAIDWTEERWMPEKLDELKELLQRSLDAPELSEREQRLVTMLALHPQHSVQETRRMVEEGWPFCPTCLREIHNEDRNNITRTLTNILNREADEYEGLLRKEISELAPIEISLPTFPDHLNEKELIAAEKSREELNKVLFVLRDKIELRRRNIYKPIPSPFADGVDEKYANAREEWLKALEQVKKCVVTFNETVNKRNKLYERVRRENFLVARKQLSAQLAGYKQAVDSEMRDKVKLDALKEKMAELGLIIRNLESQKERTDIALSYINMELQYVFFSDKKVKLVAGDGCYKLVVNGKQVRPKKISVGERNVLGLCYFFAMLFSGKRDGDKYSSEYLIVIDDPVSSFDYGNRLGVMSLLRYQLKNITKGNNNSRVVILSHDLQSVFDLQKIRADLKEGAKDRDKTFLELENRELKTKKVKNEYQKLLTRVYEYACSNQPEVMDESLDLSIGNTMRRMLEAFSSFCYNKSFEAMMRTEGIVDRVPEDKRDYYENFMCRLTLNGESHEEEHAYTLNDFTPFFTKEEKQQTAKSVLLFLLYVNEAHIKAYLKQEEVATIEAWKGQEDGWLGRDVAHV